MDNTLDYRFKIRATYRIRGYLLWHHDLGTGNILTVHKQLYVSHGKYVPKHYHLGVFGYLFFIVVVVFFSERQSSYLKCIIKK